MRTCLAILLTACGPGPRPAPPAPPTAAPSGPPLATRLAGPFASLDAFCATLAKQGGECRRDPVPSAGPFAGAELIYLQADNGDLSCTVGLQTALGWYVAAAPGEHICFEPSYRAVREVELERLDADRSVTAIHITVDWHTKGTYKGEGDEEASYRYTAVCGLVGEVPACTPTFESGCEATEGSKECEGFVAPAWKLEGNTITFNRKQPPMGTHVLLPPEPPDDATP